MKTLSRIAGVIVFVVIAGACKSTSGSVSQTEGAAAEKLEEGITEKYWKLVEVNGKPVAVNERTAREPHMILKIEGLRVTAHGGCNSMTGTYEISAGNRIRFSQVTSTMMACLDMEAEEGLKRALEMADNYSVSEDGKHLSLNRARMAPLARFEVVYLK